MENCFNSNTQKRVLAVHDISCLGKCSLTVALPVISAAGIETAVLPTAVLSTHTGGFTGFTFRDLTDDILPIVQHWKSLQLHFDAIYTGYLGSKEQLALVARLIDELAAPDTQIFIDPVMGDAGHLYASFAADFPAGMAQLCKKGQVIMPNITEACLMLGEPYREGPYTHQYIDSLLDRLSAFCTQTCVLTGVCFDAESLGCAARDVKTGETCYAFEPKINGFFHGTGDLFGSAFVAARVKGAPLQQALACAIHLVTQSIERTLAGETQLRYGVHFEECLPEFAIDLRGLCGSNKK